MTGSDRTTLVRRRARTPASSKLSAPPVLRVGRRPTRPLAPALRSAYDLGPDQDPGTGGAVVVAFDYPHAQRDVKPDPRAVRPPPCTAAVVLRRSTRRARPVTTGAGLSSWASRPHRFNLQMISGGPACPASCWWRRTRPKADSALFRARQRWTRRHGDQPLVRAGSTDRPQRNASPSRAPRASARSRRPATWATGRPLPRLPARRTSSRWRRGSVTVGDEHARLNEKLAYGGSGCSAYFRRAGGPDRHRARARGGRRAMARQWRGAGDPNLAAAQAPGLMMVDGATPFRPADHDDAKLPRRSRGHAALYSRAGDFDVVGGSNGFCRRGPCTGVGSTVETGLLQGHRTA